MFWFDGSIRNAVDKVKSSGVFMLVFVKGDDNLSKKYEKYLNEETKFKLDDFVAVKVPHNSLAHQQFKEIYVSVPVPSVFLIQSNGIPLSVVSSGETTDIQSAISEAVRKTKSKQEKKVKIQPVEKTKESLSKPSQHVRNIGRKLFNISEEELKKRLKEIRGFPKFLLLDSGSRTSLSSTTPRSARIQFKLPDSSNPSWEFPDRSTLADIKAYLTEKIGLSQSFRLLKTYPRTPFTPQDDEKTLTELSLTPSATLIVVPVEDKKVQVKVKNILTRPSFITTVWNTLLQPLYIVFDYFTKHVFGYQRRIEDSPRRLPSDTEVEKILNKKTSTSNIRGFKFEDSDSESEHPDNGNSTLQRFKK